MWDLAPAAEEGRGLIEGDERKEGDADEAEGPEKPDVEAEQERAPVV